MNNEYEIALFTGNYKIAERGKRYYRQGRVGNFEYIGDNKFLVNVKGTANYRVILAFDAEDRLSEAACDCPYTDGYCKHIAAAAFKFNPDLFNLRYDMPSIKVRELIRRLNTGAQKNDDINEGTSVILEPELSSSWGHLNFSLKIGLPGKRMYIVKDIRDLADHLDSGQRKNFGKQCNTVLHWKLLSEYGQGLARLAISIYRDSSSSYWSQSTERNFVLSGRWVDRFFELHRDKTVAFNGLDCGVKYDYPKLTFNIEKVKDSLFCMTAETDIACYAIGVRGCIFNKTEKTFYMAERSFVTNIKIIYENLSGDRTIYISESDMPAFYNTVLKPISEHIELTGDDSIEQYAPPELTSRLYIDAPDKDMITGKIVYIYGDNEYQAFAPVRTDEVRDLLGEKKTERLVMSHFKQGPEGLYISGDNNIFNFLTEGLPDLTSRIEVYASEAFKRLSVRPPAVASVGIHPEGNLLALDITAKGYNTEELLELLNAYRHGSKYHRLRDGSFAAIDKSIEDLDELAKSLNITDKAFLKENITIPQYRILYLNSLQSDPSAMRIERGRDFKRLMDKYDEIAERAEHTDAPAELRETLRPYQEHGFRWLKTIEDYGFGGILADDMGLGKTIQAIALMLNAKKERGAKSLVVCPSSLVLNWESEIKRFAPELKTLTAAGMAAARAEGLADTDQYDVIITPYQTLTRDITLYDDKHFHLQFIDEAQYIKNSKTQMAKAVKAIKSDVRFALTGTPVENSLAELWSIFDFIMPGYLFNYTFFQKNYEKPIVRKGNAETVNNLQKLTSPFILRRLKKDVLQELPEKTETILRAQMDGEQSKLYSANVLQIKQSAAAAGGKIEILAMLTRLRRICCDPSIVYENYNGTSAKLELCMELVRSCVQSGHKLLLFSQFTTMLDVIAKRFDAEKISYYMLTGATKPKDRLKMVNSFNNDGTNVFLISLKAGGTGLNLTGADIVIHYDPWWNVSAENQASDRAHRIGQKKNVQIYKLIAGDTIEERIIELQEKKRAISDLALDGEGDIMKMSVEDIMSILQ